MSLFNLQLTTVISLHDTRHGFRAERGTGTAALEAKIIQQLTAMREVVLFNVLLDIWKEYNTLDQERDLDLLTAYGVGLRTVRLLWTYWD